MIGIEPLYKEGHGRNPPTSQLPSGTSYLQTALGQKQSRLRCGVVMSANSVSSVQRYKLQMSTLGGGRGQSIYKINSIKLGTHLQRMRTAVLYVLPQTELSPVLFCSAFTVPVRRHQPWDGRLFHSWPCNPHNPSSYLARIGFQPRPPHHGPPASCFSYWSSPYQE